MGAVSSCCSAEPADSKETIGGHSTSEAARGSSRHDIDISKPMKTVSDVRYVTVRVSVIFSIESFNKL